MARRSVHELRRSRAARRPRLRILVVSEGAKTEGVYLSQFVQGLRAANVSIDILGKECGSDPLTVAEFAKKRFCSDSGYDLGYCVIDRDNHPANRFDAAIALGNSLNSKYKNRYFRVIVSDPCVEFWFLLHFVYSRSPFVAEGSKSRAERAISELKKYLPNYSKSSIEAMQRIIPLTDEAIKNAEKALADALVTQESNPSTMMHILIEKITKESR